MPGDSPDVLPRCNACTHYYITHETHFRYGCRVLGFKSQQLPMRVVMESSGQACQYFLAKAAND